MRLLDDALVTPLEDAAVENDQSEDEDGEG